MLSLTTYILPHILNAPGLSKTISREFYGGLTLFSLDMQIDGSIPSGLSRKPTGQGSGTPAKTTKCMTVLKFQRHSIFRNLIWNFEPFSKKNNEFPVSELPLFYGGCRYQCVLGPKRAKKFANVNLLKVLGIEKLLSDFEIYSLLNPSEVYEPYKMYFISRFAVATWIYIGPTYVSWSWDACWGLGLITQRPQSATEGGRSFPSWCATGNLVFDTTMGVCGGGGGSV